VRAADAYYDKIQDVKVTKDMLDLAKHVVDQKSGLFEPDKFEDHYATALVDLINSKPTGDCKGAAPRRERGRSDGCVAPEHRPGRAGARKTGQEGAQGGGRAERDLMPIEGKKTTKTTVAKKSSPKAQRKSAYSSPREHSGQVSPIEFRTCLTAATA
jgi:DNA end-binding protein Ku